MFISFIIPGVGETAPVQLDIHQIVGGIAQEVCCTERACKKVQIIVVDLYVDPIIIWWVVNKDKALTKLLKYCPKYVTKYFPSIVHYKSKTILNSRVKTGRVCYKQSYTVYWKNNLVKFGTLRGSTKIFTDFMNIIPSCLQATATKQQYYPLLKHKPIFFSSFSSQNNEYCNCNFFVFFFYPYLANNYARSKTLDLINQTSGFHRKITSNNKLYLIFNSQNYPGKI